MNYSNNAYSVLNGGISASDTAITLAAGTGARFPASNFNVTLIGYDGLGNESSWEICLCSSRSGDVLTVARGQEGTTASAWPGATRIEARLTAGAAAEMATKSGTETLTNKTLANPTINGMTGGTQVINIGAGQFYKDMSGNIGIGTTTPSSLYSMDHLLAMMKNQNGTTRVTLANNTVGANAVATFKIIGGSPNSFFDMGLADNNGAPYAVLSTGSGVQRLSFSVGGGEAARIDTSKKTTLYGDLGLSGTARRITGDFSNLTIANRTLLKTNVENEPTILSIVPNGTSVESVVRCFNSDSDPANSSSFWSGVVGGQTTIRSDKNGSGAYLPMALFTAGAERLRIDTSGNVLATGGALGYGVGAGGNAVQSPNNTSNVILNKPNGVITLANGSIASAARIVFALQNSLIDTNSIVVAHGLYDGSSPAIEHLTVQAVYAQPGFAFISVKNNATGDIATNGVKIRFAVFAGSSS